MHSLLNTLLSLHSAFMLCMVKMPLKGEVGGHELNSHERYIVDHGKSWNCVFEYLWEPCLKKETFQETRHFGCLPCIFTGPNMQTF